MEEIIQINELPVAQLWSLLCLCLYATAFNPGTAAPRCLRLPKGRARTFPDLPLAVITLVPRHLYQRYPHLAINLRDGEIDGRERVTCNFAKTGKSGSGQWACWPVEHCLVPARAKRQPMVTCTNLKSITSSARSTAPTARTHVPSSKPHYRIGFDNEKDIKLQLRMLLNVSDRYFADADDHLFEENVTMVSRHLSQHGLRLERHDRCFRVLRLTSDGHWLPVANPSRLARPRQNQRRRPRAQQRAQQRQHRQPPRQRQRQGIARHRPQQRAGAYQPQPARVNQAVVDDADLNEILHGLFSDEAQPDVNPRVEIDPQARFLPALPVAEPLLLGNFEGANMPEPNALPFGPDDWLPDDQAHDDHGEMEMDELIQLLQENI
ncbi:uncharacterized protein MONBRDRAFT_38921 [Monosiga brevicollis MX1]|uniref:Uncharacterized protein n=1 Tax=Monosiga brevicollis TaxID=81824 RepID=A9VAZ9_MONBE|nr:uncharacterized protein MONBRDRAFT_38921 [Monosiga brevicollis MX1]EDQ85252.1 predicted protein [Monosiga brevicollis MX1]|eukprot:XP_001749873.1 hypothetical protein [Monosiga brevicollis MX1]